jgi:hypothetical protein
MELTRTEKSAQIHEKNIYELLGSFNSLENI